MYPHSVYIYVCVCTYVHISESHISKSFLSEKQIILKVYGPVF